MIRCAIELRVYRHMKNIIRIYLNCLMTAGLVYASTGCGKKDAAVQTAPTTTSTTSSTSPAPTPVAHTAPPAAPVANTADLETLTQALRRYSMERRKVPTDLNEVMAAGYLKGMPAAPVGNKFGINTKRLEVVLVNQ